MGGKNDSPDYAAGAAAQGEANEAVVRDQTYANRPTQYTPWGATSWQTYEDIDPASGEEVTRWKQNQQLSPELQDIFNKQVGIQGGRTDIAGLLTNRLGAEFGTPADWRGLNPMGEVPVGQYTMPEGTQRSLDYSGVGQIGDPREMRQRAENAVYGKAQSRLAPQYEGKRNALEIKLRNQGLQPGDESWNSQMQAIDQQETDAYGQAQYDAVRAGLGEQAQDFGQQTAMRNIGTGEIDRMGNFANQANQQAFNQAYGSNQANFGQAMQGSQYANQIRQQQMTEQMQQRGFSLNEINALLSGQQVNAPQMPNFSQAGVAQAAPIYQSTVDQGNFDQANNPMSGLMDIGGMAAGGMLGNPGLFGQ